MNKLYKLVIFPFKFYQWLHSLWSFLNKSDLQISGATKQEFLRHPIYLSKAEG